MDGWHPSKLYQREVEGKGIKQKNEQEEDHKSSVTRLGDLLHFGQLLKAFGNNYFAQISHILRQIL